MQKVKTIAPGAEKVERGGDEGQSVALGNEVVDDPNAFDQDSSKPKSKRPRLRGPGRRTADDDAAEEEAEAEADLDKPEDNEDNASEDSGLYSADENAPDDADNELDLGNDKLDKEDEAGDDQPRTRAGANLLAEFDNDAADEELAEAGESGQLVYASKLVKNEMSLVVTLPSSQCAQKLMVSEMIMDVAAKVFMQDPDVRGVQKVHINEKDNGDVWIECEGTNLRAFHTLPTGTVDLDHITTNDIAKVMEVYGVEACRTSIVQNIRAVFGHYGIEVNHRHLYLIADYMTLGGNYRAFNRRGMEHCTSPLLAMSYETTMEFLMKASQSSISEKMKSPAASIVLGQTPHLGTGMVSVLVDLEQGGQGKKKRKFSFS